jgi:hypothetical protein
LFVGQHPAEYSSVCSSVRGRSAARRNRGNYLNIGYAIFGALGSTPEAQAIWLDWAHMRPQDPPDHPETRWRSIVKQTPRSGVLHLVGVANRFAGGQRAAHMFASAPEVPDDVDADGPATDSVDCVTLAEFVGAYEPLSYVAEGLLTTTALYTVTAPTSHGKTAFLVALALAIATGRKDILGLEVKQGRIAYLSYENSKDVQMRFMAALHGLKIDADVLGREVMIVPAKASPERIIAKLRRLSAPGEGGPFSLVVVDTLQAAFDGDDFNKAKQVLDLMRNAFRPLVALPGNPCVVVAAHPTKNADKTSLVPYGGGSIINEIDGNLTLWKDDRTEIVELHWQRKWRGLHFDPRSFVLDLVDPPKAVDDKGRIVRLPVLKPLTAAQRAQKAFKNVPPNIALLQAIVKNPAGSTVSWGRKIGRHHSNVSRLLKGLETDGLTVKAGDKWALTSKGRKRASELPLTESGEEVV